MKGALLTACSLLVAVGIFAGMVIYTISVLRQYQWYILTGECTTQTEIAQQDNMQRPCLLARTFSCVPVMVCQRIGETCQIDGETMLFAAKILLFGKMTVVKLCVLLYNI